MCQKSKKFTQGIWTEYWYPKWMGGPVFGEPGECRGIKYFTAFKKGFDLTCSDDKERFCSINKKFNLLAFRDKIA